ncbi:MAG: HAMP domain-containing histidine kinase [Campylobacterales bacterium]
MNMQMIGDADLVREIGRRLDEKNASLRELEFMTKKLTDLNQRLIEMDSVKTRFLSLIKNEFNNPISSVLNLCNLLLSKKHPEKHDEIVKMAHMELLRLDFQVKNIIAASEIEAGHTENYFSRITLTSILDEVLLSFGYLMADKNLSLEVKDEIGEPIVSDSQKLYLILLNLISNACEFSFRDQKIVVRFAREGEMLVLEVQDTGESIDVVHKLSVYNRFTQYSKGLTRPHTGLGLGLSVAKGMVEALNGAIDFESQEGGVTTFVVHLPLVDPAMCASSSESSGEFLFDDFDSAVEM